MIDRYQGNSKAIFIADRQFETYNVFAHILEKGMFYLIRIKDLGSNGILSSRQILAQLPTGQSSFDITVNMILTRKQTKETRADPYKYHFLPSVSPFDFLDLHYRKYYEMKLRILRFPISEESFECIVTNLPPEDFPPEDIK